MSHTPGPWTAAGDYIISKNRHIALVSPKVGSDSETADNARLMAASPDLLESLEILVENYGDPAEGRIAHARSAIAKARGK